MDYSRWDQVDFSDDEDAEAEALEKAIRAGDAVRKESEKAGADLKSVAVQTAVEAAFSKVWHAERKAPSRPAGPACFMCLEELALSAEASLECGHQLHESCLLQLQKMSGEAPSCPVCAAVNKQVPFTRVLSSMGGPPVGKPARPARPARPATAADPASPAQPAQPAQPPQPAPAAASHVAEPDTAPEGGTEEKVHPIPDWARSATLLRDAVISWTYRTQKFATTGEEPEKVAEAVFLEWVNSPGGAGDATTYGKKRREASMAKVEGALKPIRELLEARAADAHTDLVYRQAGLADALVTAVMGAMASCALPEEYVPYIDDWLSDVACLRPKVEGPWPVGKAVMLADLAARPELNGCFGTCSQWVAKSGRFAVDVDGHGRVAVRPENVKSDPELIKCAMGDFDGVEL